MFDFRVEQKHLGTFSLQICSFDVSIPGHQILDAELAACDGGDDDDDDNK